MRDLSKELSKLPPNFIIGLITNSDDYEDINMGVLDFLLKTKGSTGSYITVNRPYINVIDVLKANNIDHKKLHFIDCITKTLGGKVSKVPNCEFVESPSHLTDIAIALHKYVSSSNEKNRFLHVDSLSTLCIHNDTSSVLKFVHYLTGKMRLFGLNGIIISLREETDKKLIGELSQFCDKMIHI